MKINGLVLAAGMSSRMGKFKPLLEMNGRTMIEQSIESMLVSGVDKIVVVLGYRGEDIEAVLDKAIYRSRIQIVYNENYETTEMLDSVKIGVQSIDDCDAFFLLPGDMPAICTSTFVTLKRTMEKEDRTVIFPVIDGYKKHPPLISNRCIPDILNFESDGGLRDLWKNLSDDTVLVPIEDKGCLMDADTMAQYLNIYQYQ